MPLITTLAAAFGLALLFGFVAVRLRLPALVGYLLAGVLIGPFTPGFVADTALAGELAELGVMLLMFGVGLHFSIEDLMRVRSVAVPGAVVQMAVATALGAALASGWGWPLPAALIFGLSLSVASTVVLLRALEAQGTLDSSLGRIAVGWLVVEDLAMVLVLVLLPALVGLSSGESDGATLGATLGRTLLAVGAFVALMLYGGRRALPALLRQIAGTGSRELFTLCVIAVAVGIAFGAAALFGVSVALGAFFAGLVLRESELSHRAAEESLPFRDAFAVLFFVSVGMLFDPRVLLERPLEVLGVAAVVMIGKSFAAMALVLALRYPLNVALTVSASLAQIGEFSFILIGLGLALGVMPAEAQSLVVAGAMVSIALNPLLFSLAEPLRQAILRRSSLARRLEARDDPLAELPADTARQGLEGQTVLVGWSHVGRAAAAHLRAQGRRLVIVEQDRAPVEALRAAGEAAVCGDAAEPGVLIQAHIAQAAALVVTLRATAAVPHMIETARRLNPTLEITVLAPDADEAAALRQAGADHAVESVQAVAAWLARPPGADPDRAGAPVPAPRPT